MRCIDLIGVNAATAQTQQYSIASVVSGMIHPATPNGVRMVTPDGIIHTVAGNGIQRYSLDGGPGASAKVGAWGLALGTGGRIYVADPWNSVIPLLPPA